MTPGSAFAAENCLRCPLAQTRRNAAMPRITDAPWEGYRVLVGEGPGRDEDEQGQAFVGRSGKLLDRALEEIGAPQVFITNSVRCRPPNNRDPVANELRACAGYLHEEVDDAEVVVALGRTADAQLTALGIEHEHVWHPAYVLRNMGRYEEWKTQLQVALSIN